MLSQEVEKMLKGQLSAEQVSVQVDGSHYQIVVVSEAFAGLNKVKRQQLVYAALNEKITSGEMHAVYLHLYTADEYAAQ